MIKESPVLQQNAKASNKMVEYAEFWRPTHTEKLFKLFLVVETSFYYYMGKKDKTYISLMWVIAGLLCMVDEFKMQWLSEIAQQIIEEKNICVRISITHMSDMIFCMF